MNIIYQSFVVVSGVLELPIVAGLNLFFLRQLQDIRPKLYKHVVYKSFMLMYIEIQHMLSNLPTDDQYTVASCKRIWPS